MGLQPTCTIPPPRLSADKDSESGSGRNKLHYLSAETSSLYSQPSLPSVPSLTTYANINSSNIVNGEGAAHHVCVSTLKGHSSYVFSLALAGKFLYSGSANGEIRVWDAHPAVAESRPETTSDVSALPQGAIKSMVIIMNPRELDYKLFTAHQDQKIRVWRIGGTLDYKAKAGGAGGCHRQKLVATLPTLMDRVLRYLPPKNHVQVRRHKKCTWVHHVDAVSALVLSGDGSTLFSASWDRSFKVWRTSDCACLESVTDAHDDAINAIALSGDGFLYTGSADTKIKVWRPSSEEEKKLRRRRQYYSLVATLEKHKSAINALALSSDGSVLYSGACDRSIVVWGRELEEAEVGGDHQAQPHMAVVGALRGHTRAILCLAVAASDLVISGSADKTVRIWRRGATNKMSYSCLGVLEGHTGPVKCLTAVPTSSEDTTSTTAYTLYSGSMDCDIKVWQLSLPNSTADSTQAPLLTSYDK